MNTSEQNQPTVACFGEILWDSMPQGLFLGGAPLNVAYHLTRLEQPSLMISSVGRDELGYQAIQKAEAYGIDISCIQISETFPTGISEVTLDDSKNAVYHIRQPAAWDSLSYTELLKDKLIQCPAFVFGTLASRSAVSRNTLFKILDTYQGLTLCDVNLRKPHEDRDSALKIARKAQVVKLNEDELHALSGTDRSTSTLEEALVRFRNLVNPSMIFVTRGGKTAVYFDGSRTIYASPPKHLKIVDTVGAGDAFTAALIQGLLRDIKIEDCLENAVRLGSLVAAKHGAQPEYEFAELAENVLRT
ncbi:MAG: fructokinase [Candidatus Pelagisphaera sp.]|jgi:fructokinase